MKLRQFTLQQPIPNVQITPREEKSHRKMIIKHDELYARAWKWLYEMPISDNDHDNVVSRIPPKLQYDLIL